MTIIDLIVLAATVTAVVQVWRIRRKAMDNGILITLIGLLIWASFFLADLAIMHGGHLISDRPAMEIMRDLHATFYWLGGVAGLLMVSLGVTLSHGRHQSASSPLETFIEVIDHLPDPCMIIADNKIVAVNQPLDDMVYQDKEMLLGKNPYQIWDALEFNIPPRPEIQEALAT
ncbi:MAG: hypothetical protein WD356_05230, partial [Pseudomonadales bacterium]